MVVWWLIGYGIGYKIERSSVQCPVDALSPNFIMLTLRQSPGQVAKTQIMKVRDTNHVATFHYLCPGLCHKHLNMLRWFVSATFPTGKFW